MALRASFLTMQCSKELDDDLLALDVSAVTVPRFQRYQPGSVLGCGSLLLERANGYAMQSYRIKQFPPPLPSRSPHDGPT
jgi:hypothetical protein